MGRSASTLENLVGFDPVTYAQRRQQLFNAPVAQAQNPYERMGAALGNIAGGAIFGLEDPNLKRAADINRIYADVMTGTDPTQPDFVDRLGSLTQRLSQAGYGDAAMYAANQARAIRKEIATESRAERGLTIQEEAAQDLRYKNNPELLIQDARALPDDDPRKQTLINRYYDIKQEQQLRIEKEKASVDLAQAQSARYRALAAKEGQEGIIGQPGPVGKGGGFRDVNGQIYGPSEMAKERAAFRALGTMLERVNEISYGDVKSAESIFDYTQESGIIKGAAGKLDRATVDAQSRIAAAQLLEQIDSLPPGSASDADMKAAKASFPGYGSAENLRRWVNDTKRRLDRNYNDYADRFGFDKKIKATPLLEKPTKGKETAPTPAQSGEWKLL